MRVLATIMLVSCHVIGDAPDAGLRIGYPSLVRLVNDLLVDVRMPIFAFISGFVYAIRPADLGGLGGFVGGKVRRLIVPGAIAITAALVARSMLGIEHPLPGPGDIADFHVFPYLHCWFLQAIFVILVVFGAADSVFRFRLPALAALWLASVGACAIVPEAHRSFFSTAEAAYLAPYFLLASSSFGPWTRSGRDCTSCAPSVSSHSRPGSAGT